MTRLRFPKRKILLGLTLSPLLVLTGLSVFGATVGLNAFREAIAAEVAERTGRTVTLAGDLRLLFSIQPTLVIEDLAIANTDWGSRPSMLRVGRMEGQIALLPLLSGRLVVRRLALTDTELLLETDKLGRVNWAFNDADRTDVNSPVFLPVIDELSFAGLALVWHSGAGTDRTTFAVDRLTVSGLGRDNKVVVDMASGRVPTSCVPALILRMSIASKGSAFRISALDGRLGASDLSGELEFVPREGHQRIRGQLSSRHVQLADLFRATQASKGKTNKTSRPSGRVFSNAPFGIKIPESLQAEVTYRAERLTGPGFALDNLSTQVLVDRGVLSLNDFAARLHGATLTGQGTFNTAGDPPTHAATVDG